MPNRTYIDTYQRINTRTNGNDYMIDICDDHDHTSLIFPIERFFGKSGETIPSDNVELIKFLMEEKHNTEHGSSCEALEGILERARKDFTGIIIGGHKFDGHLIKEVLDYDIREVFFCPKCGWESYSEGDIETSCGQCGCDGKITESKKEWYVI
jgi:hypothetical protein